MAIPELLKTHPRWLLWTIDGSGRKVPRAYTKPHKNIDANRASNWGDYEHVTDAATRSQMGIGFALGSVQDGPTFCGVDLDKCRDLHTGAIEPWAQRIIDHLRSYTEVSPSGTGVKIFMTGQFPEHKAQPKIYKLEMYDHSRYFTVTGEHLPNTPSTIEDRTIELKELYERTFSRDLIQLVKLFGFWLSDGRDFVNIECPWKANHSGGTQERDAGLHVTDGKVDGFHCFHAGCAEKNLGDLRKFFGLKGGDSGDFIVDHHGNIIARSQENIRRAFQLMNVKLDHDIFRDRMFLTASARRVLDDPALDRLYLVMEEAYHFSPPREYFLMVTMDLARSNPVHPVNDYLNTVTWDGLDRLDTWLIVYGGAEDTKLNRAIGAKTLIAAVRRIRQPGVKFDQMLVLESEQGARKSTAISALCPHPDWFSDDLPLNVESKQVIERTQGRWLIEASDLSGMRKSEVEHLKAMLSRRVDGPVRLAYATLSTDKPRSFIIIGTTNDDNYLKDVTGNRRFWPVKVKPFDIEHLMQDRDQLWAEAVKREEAGEHIWLEDSLWDAATDAQNERVEIDPWEELIRESDIDLTSSRIRADALWALLGVSHNDPRHGSRLKAVMTRLGFVKKRCWEDSKYLHFWVRVTERRATQADLLDTRPDYLKT